MSDDPVLKPQPPVPGRPNNHAEIMGLQSFLTGLSLVVVGLRIWVRRTVLKTFGWDDWFILLSLLFSLTSLGCFVGLIRNGGGHHWWDIGVPEEWEALLQWEHIHIIINITGVGIVKISVCLALLRFLHGRWYKIFLKSLIVFLILFTISTEGPLVFRCWPTYYIWSIDVPDGVCIPDDKFMIVANINAVLNIVTDAVLVLLPIPTILSLKVNIQTKVSLIAVLSIGFVATAAAIVRAVAGNDGAEITDDSWTLQYYVWNSTELNLGIIAASLPTLRPLFSSWFESTASRFRTGSSGRSRSGGLGGPGTGAGRSHIYPGHTRAAKHGYQKQREGESYALEESTKWGGDIKSNNATVISSSRGAYGLENNSSEEEILERGSGITKQTEIIVHKDV